MTRLAATDIGRRLLSSVALIAWAAAGSSAVTLEVHNSVGGVYVEASLVAGLQIRGQSTGRKLTQEDIRIVRAPGRIVVRCDPPDSEPIDLHIRLPFNFLLEATTTSGAIAVTGMIRRARLQTESGDLFLSAPWRSTRIRLDAEEKPKVVKIARGLKFSRKRIDVTPERTIWRLRDRLDDPFGAYGEFRVKAKSPGEVELTDHPIPKESPIKSPWQAPALLEEILRGPPAPSSFTENEPKQPKADFSIDDSSLLFRSDVRMVNLVLAASDEAGQPVTDLSSEDFEVLEDGVLQKVAFAGSEDVPFNLAILLDLSGSTKAVHSSMREAAAKFVGLARPGDRVAVYALFEGGFHVVSKLIDQQEALVETIERITPEATWGASPIYDTVVLAYAEDLRYRPGERNGLIVVSDGIDHRFSHQEMPSRVSFKKLLEAAGQIDALIYPVFLRSGERFGRDWSRKARKRMQKLADASGGRLFPALSIQDLEPVFPLVADELRSVYSVAYYPKNQVFRGEWRTVHARVTRPGVKVRARVGYYAR